jgi:hypothetical protein
MDERVGLLKNKRLIQIEVKLVKPVVVYDKWLIVQE